MVQIHEKSVCCRKKIWRFGNRRRQCSSCKRTWSAWPKKRGRKRKRLVPRHLAAYLGDHARQASRSIASARLSYQAYTARRRALRSAFLRCFSWPVLPDGELVLLCDALLQSFQGTIWTLYLFLVRSVSGTRAVILPPYLRSGREASRGGWKSAFQTLPASVIARTIALVSDGAGEAIQQARKHGWVLQRCQFHLLMSLANYVRPGPLSRHKHLAGLLYPRVCTILYERDESRVQQALVELESQVLPLIRTRKLATVISGFLKHYRDYRAYLAYPDYALPATTGSMESFISQIRSFLFRAKGFRTPESYAQWIEALCKYRGGITCNGKHQQS